MLLAFLLAAPMVFVLGPLALLLLLSRPRTAREWLWIGASVSLAYVMISSPAPLPERTLRGAGVLFTGAFVMASLTGITSLLRRALVGVGVAVVGMVAWFTMLRVRWADLRDAIIAQQWATSRLIFPDLPEGMPAPDVDAIDVTVAFASEMARGVTLTADLWPAINGIFALAGGWLAWTWYHRIASSPIGAPPHRLRDFTFSDQAVWLVIITGGLTLAPLPPGVHLVASNLLLFLLALYFVRGLAVIRTALLPAPAGLVFLLTTFAILLLPLALIVTTLTGLADTWLDLRRRMAPPEGASL